jgi:WD40 repeat protein
MKKNRGVFGNNPRTAMASIAYSETGSFLSGSIDGFIFYWDGTTCSKVRKTHQGCVMAINCIGGNIYSSGT